MGLNEGALQNGSFELHGEYALQLRRMLRAAVRELMEREGAVVADRQVDVLLARLADSMLEGLVLCGRHADVIYVNDSLCQMLGRSRVELIGRSASEYFGDLFARFCEPLAQREGASPFERCDAELRTKSGETIVVQVSTQRIDGERGTHLGCFAMVMDITARAKTEAALRQSQSELRLLSAQLLGAQELERQRIARELHDEIGSALGGIKFGLETCEELVATGSAAAALEAIRHLSARTHSVVEEVRRIAMDLRPSTLDDLGILPTIGWFTREFKSLYGHLNLETIVDVCEDEVAAPVKIAIYRIVQEACNNAVTHSQARKLSLILRRTGSRIQLLVRDDGTGFDPTDFAAVDPTGRGLGLASMRERADMTGGRLRLYSEHGRGTTVRVTWPSSRHRLGASDTDSGRA